MRRSLTGLISALTPVIQARVARSLVRRPPSQRGIRHDVEDLVQEVLLSLFADDGRVLRNWSPEKGLSLLNYVGLVTERRVASTLRSGKKNWREEIAPTEELDRPRDEKSSEQALASRELLRHLLESLRRDLSPQGWTMFRLLFVEERTLDEVGRGNGPLRRRDLRLAEPPTASRQDIDANNRARNDPLTANTGVEV